MSKVLCVFPKDSTTAFLDPLMEAFIERYSAIPLLGDPQSDDDYFDRLSELSSESDIIIFLGHGTSEKLYGVNFNELILADNVDVLRGKRLVLFSCNSVDFLKRFKLHGSLGFGIVPTSSYDTQTRRLHSLDLSDLISCDLDYIQQAIVRIWLKTIKEADITDIRRFYTVFSYYTTVEIIRCLTSFKSENFRLIADILYYLKADMDYVE